MARPGWDWVPSIANINAPTTTELNAGMLLQHADQGRRHRVPAGDRRRRHQLAGLDVQHDGQRPDQLLEHAAAAEEAVRHGHHLHDPDPDTAGYVVIRRSIASTTAWASSQPVEVYPALCGEVARMDPEPNCRAVRDPHQDHGSAEPACRGRLTRSPLSSRHLVGRFFRARPTPSRAGRAPFGTRGGRNDARISRRYSRPRSCRSGPCRSACGRTWPPSIEAAERRLEAEERNADVSLDGGGRVRAHRADRGPARPDARAHLHVPAAGAAAAAVPGPGRRAPAPRGRRARSSPRTGSSASTPRRSSTR
jgi:hypothetical protein